MYTMAQEENPEFLKLIAKLNKCPSLLLLHKCRLNINTCRAQKSGETGNPTLQAAKLLGV